MFYIIQRKDLGLQKKLMEFDPKINWIPIQNMTTEQVKQLLCDSKVYIDFGNHPGKDRFPREAAMCGCCVITGRKGSARNDKDVNIDNSYKIEDNEKNIPIIINKIHECLDNYDKCHKDYENYINKIKGEQKQFEDDIKNIFIINK